MPNASIDSPIDDLTYDVITVLHAKAKALEAYEKYIADADEDDEARQVFEDIKRQDQEHVRVLKEVLARRLDEDLGYVDEEDYEDEEYEDEAEDEEYVEAEARADGGEAGEHRGEASTKPDDEPPPRRGESSHRRGA